MKDDSTDAGPSQMLNMCHATASVAVGRPVEACDSDGSKDTPPKLSANAPPPKKHRPDAEPDTPKANTHIHPNPCKTCGARFRTRWLLQNHMKAGVVLFCPKFPNSKTEKWVDWNV